MRRKAMAQREASGRVRRQQQQQHEQQMPSAAEVQRLRTAALAGMRDAVWGTTLGYLHLSGKITASQFAAGKMWSDLCREYARATVAPQAPRSASLERSASTSIDPDSDEGRKEARRHERTQQWFLAASAVLAHSGALRVRAVAQVCERNEMPTGLDGLEHLADGLQALVAFWRSGGHKRR